MAEKASEKKPSAVIDLDLVSPRSELVEYDDDDLLTDDEVSSH